MASNLRTHTDIPLCTGNLVQFGYSYLYSSVPYISVQRVTWY